MGWQFVPEIDKEGLVSTSKIRSLKAETKAKWLTPWKGGKNEEAAQKFLDEARSALALWLRERLGYVNGMSHAIFRQRVADIKSRNWRVVPSDE